MLLFPWVQVVVLRKGEKVVCSWRSLTVAGAGRSCVPGLGFLQCSLEDRSANFQSLFPSVPEDLFTQ